MKATFNTDNGDKIDVDALIKEFAVMNLDVFKGYLKEIWKDLAQRSDDKTKGINKITFSKYYELPGIICDRLFSVFDSDQNDYLDLSEFIRGMMILFSESFENLIKFIFNFYDFDKDGQISKEDVRVVLSYVPLNTKDIKQKYKLKFEQEDFKDRIESQDELHATLDKVFSSSDYFDEDSFRNVVENVNSDIFLFILIFLLEKRPFTQDTIKQLEKPKKGSLGGISMGKSPQPGATKLIVSPSLHSKFKPSVTISKSPTMQKRSLLLGDDSTAGGEKKNMLLRLAGRSSTGSHTQQTGNIISLQSLAKEKVCDDADIDEGIQIKIPVSRKVRHGLQELDKNMENKKYQGNDIPLLPALKFQTKGTGDDPKNVGPVTVLNVEDEDEDSNVNYEGYLYKFTQKKRLKKLWFKLIYKDLYYFKSSDDPAYKGMHNLSGVYVKEGQPLLYDGLTYYCFNIIYPKKVRVYYCDDEEVFYTWFTNLKRAIGYSDLSELYEVKEKLGNGKFGLVRLGIHKESGRKVAIKIMNKKEMTIQDLELVKTEIEILKIAQHPHIIRLYDVFENSDYIYISKK